jgi:hypothetical protein
MRRFASTVSNEELGGMLAHSGDERACRALEMLLDPAYSRFTLAKLCQRLGLSTLDLLELFRRHMLDMGIIEMSRRAPAIMEDVARDAESRMEACRECAGTGMVKDKSTGEKSHCLHCSGEGQVRVPGDYRARNLMFQTLGLIKK